MCQVNKRTYGIELEGYTDEDIRDNCLSGWEFIEDGSLTDGSEECDSCEGSGNYWDECWKCDGSGRVDCDECDGSGRVYCDECDGSHEWDCGECNGTGEDDEGEECSCCEGGGIIYCEHCDNDGRNDCCDCEGEGRIECPRCDGEGGENETCNNCDGDGYTGSGNKYGVECVSRILEEGDYSAIDDVYDYIERYDWQVEEDCGTHVHVGANDLTAQDLSRLTILMNIVEPVIFGTQPSIRFSGSYSRKTKKDVVEYLIRRGDEITLEELASKYYGYNVDVRGHFQKYDHMRYYGLNLHSYFYRKTLEFRYFKGSECREEAKSYIDLCIKLVDFAKHTTFEQLKVIGAELSSSSSLNSYLSRVKSLLGTEYIGDRQNNLTYAEALSNLPREYRNDRQISEAV